MSDIIVPQSDVKLCTRNVNLYYGENHALKDINLDIKTNKITAFIGPSGCGKSTYLKSLNRMNDLIPDCKITGRFPALTARTSTLTALIQTYCAAG